MSSSPQRAAAIDIGTNSVHMIVAERQGRGYRVIDKEKEMVQLGAGSLDGEPLTEKAIERAIVALRRMSDIARTLDADRIVAVATSAVREAPNRDQFLRRARDEAAIDVRVISGEEEGGLIFEAVRAAVDFGDSTCLCIDIGGGSVELIVGTQREIFFVSSLPIGALRLTERFLLTDPPKAKEIRQCRQFVRRKLRRAFGSIASVGFDFVIGTSGTIESLASMATGEEEAPAASLRSLDRVELEHLLDELASLSVDERVEQFSLDHRRAQVVVAGAIVLDEILHELRVTDLRACNAALREGLMNEMFVHDEEAISDAGGVRRVAVTELANRSGIDSDHAAHVAGLACSIFDQTEDIHGLGEAERELLEYAALLHEIGLQVSYQRHHKHTYYLIRHASLDGFTAEQIAVLANVARYHRKARPKKRHENFAELGDEQQAVVAKLSAILRLAEGLDRGRRGAVRRVELSLGKKKVRIDLHTQTDLMVELDSAEKASKLFTRVFGLKAEFDIKEGLSGRRRQTTKRRSGLTEARF